MTPFAKNDLTGPRGESYRKMIEGSVTGRAGTPDEVGSLAALLTGAVGPRRRLYPPVRTNPGSVASR